MGSKEQSFMLHSAHDWSFQRRLFT